MKGSTSYLVAIISLSFSAYQFYLEDLREFTLYFILGLTFAVMGLSREDRFKKYKWLVGLSWLLVIASGIMFLFVLRTDF
jgi:hypothetical protein